MNVVILTYIFYPEPIVMSTITEDLAMELSKQHIVTVVSSKPCRPYGYKIPVETQKNTWNFKRVFLNSYNHPQSDLIGRLKENISFGQHAARYIRDNHSEIDVIYMNVFPLFAQNMVIKEAMKYGIPTVNHVEDIYPEPFKQKNGILGNILFRICLPIDRWNLVNATKSVVIGNKIKEYLVKSRNIDGHNIDVVYNWQDMSRFDVPIYNIDSNIFTFMYVGSLSRAADIYNVVDAFIKAELPSCRLILAGTGTEKENLTRYINGFKNISIKDAPYADIPKIQGEADALILPLLKDVSLRAVPSKLPAYLFSKKPIIACVESDSDVAKIVLDSSCGWVTPPQNAMDLAKVMRQVVSTNVAELVSKGKSGYEFAQKYLTKSVNLEKLVKLITSLKS